MVSSNASISRQPSGSPRKNTEASTPTTGVMSVPMAASEAGNRRNAANQDRYARPSP